MNGQTYPTRCSKPSPRTEASTAKIPARSGQQSWQYYRAATQAEAANVKFGASAIVDRDALIVVHVKQKHMDLQKR